MKKLCEGSDQIIFRKVKDSGDEPRYKGWRYSLPIDDTIHKFFIDNDGLHVIKRNDEQPKLIYPIGEPIEKYEQDFHEPIGKKLLKNVKNTGIGDCTNGHYVSESLK